MVDYLASLNIKLTIFLDDTFLIPRLAQMTQKTNQFNLSTKRYTENEISDFIKNGDCTVIALQAEDKFGDNGVTGMAIIEIDQKKRSAVIDSMLMSCRIIGRKIEYVFFDYIVKYLKEQKLETVRAKYIKTLKNEIVNTFYDSLDFKLLESDNSIKIYELFLKDYTGKNVHYMEVEIGRSS